MKNKIKQSIFVIIITILISSCAATHVGYMTDSASLSSANFSYAKQNIKGEANTTYLLGIGGLAKETLVGNAKLDMLKNNPLKDNQTLANVTVNFKYSFYLGMVRTVRCTVTADVVEFK